MKAFKDTPISKEFIISEIKEHIKADRLVQGSYWTDGKGCAVGCSIRSAKIKLKLEIKEGDHSQYEKLMGIPEWLAHLQDRIFEGLDKKESSSWVLDFFEAINVGADLEKAKYPILIGIVESSYNDFDHDQSPECKKAIDDVLDLLRSSETDVDKLRSVRNTAHTDAYDAAAHAAADAVANAADATSAAAADAADAASAAAIAAANAVANAAGSAAVANAAGSAADAAANAAGSAADARYKELAVMILSELRKISNN